MKPEGIWRDYSYELRIHRSPTFRWLLWSVSTLCLTLGVIGIFLPLLPTTPFILVSAYCYARCSPRFYNALMNHERLGPPLRQWVENRSISPRAKALALTMIAVTLVPSALFFVPVMAVKIGLLAIGASVSLYIWRLPRS